MQQDEKLLATLFTIGVLAALGKLLISANRPPWPVILGRAILAGLTAMAACALLFYFTNASTVAIVGLACAISVAGVEMVELWLRKLLKVDDHEPPRT